MEFEYYGRREEAIILEQERMEEVAKKEIEKIIKINKKKLNEASLNVLNIEGTAKARVSRIENEERKLQRQT